MAASFVLLLAAFLAAARPAAAGAWQPIGPEGGQILSLDLAAQPSGTLYAGGPAGVFKSVDGAASWTLARRGLPAAPVRIVKADPTDANVVFAAVDDQGIAKSVDGGASWTSGNQGLQAPGQLRVTALAIDPRSPATLYAALQPFIWKSTDGGSSWARQSSASQPIVAESLAIAPGPPYPILAGTPQGVLRSFDGGATWQAATAQPQPHNVVAFAFPPRGGATVFAASRDSGVWRSDDFGASWKIGGLAVPRGLLMTALAADPSLTGALYAAAATSDFQGLPGNGAVFRSFDGGATWRQLAVARPAQRVLALVLEPGAPSSLLAGTDTGVYRSQDRARGWSPANHGLRAQEVFQVAVDGSHPGALYVIAGGGVYRTGNGGQSWSPISVVPFATTGLALDPQGTLYLVNAGSLLASSDGGRSFRSLVSCLGPVAVDPRHPGTLYTFEPGNSLKSTDGGRTWSDSLTGVQCLEPYLLVIDPLRPKTLFASGSFIDVGCQFAGVPGAGLWKSFDGGAHWALDPQLGEIDDLAADPFSATTIDAVAASSLWQSRDGGASWSAIASLPDVFALTADPKAPGVLYAGRFLSRDGGLHFTFAGGDAGALDPGIVVHRLAVDPGPPRTLYAATSSGLFRLLHPLQ